MVSSFPRVCLPLLASIGMVRAQDAEPVTFTEHVAKIVFQRCTSCHRPGEVAPFPLTNYREVRKKSRMIARVTKKRIMPPWLPVKGHGEFADSLRLSKEEIDVFARWAAAGAPEGDPEKLPPMPEFTEGWQLGEPDLIVSMPKGFEVPAAGPDIYRNFVVPVALDEDRWVTAIEVRPGSRSVLHHIIFSQDKSGRSRARDGKDGQPGFTGMRGNRRGTTAGLGGWAVGGMPRHLPMGLAIKLEAGADLILQSHFHPSGKPETERTTLGLYFTDEPPKRTMVALQLPPMFGAGAGLDVPAGESSFRISEKFELPVDAQAITVGGHAHMICRDMRIHAKMPDGEKRSIFWIDDWDFDWQNRYQYAEPLDLPAGSEIEAVITYDNSAQNPDNPFDPPRRIRWGLQSTDEMGSVTLLLVAKEERDTRKLQRAIRSHMREHFRNRRARGAGAASLLSRVRMLDRNGDGRIERDEIPERYRRQVMRLDTNSDGVVDEDELEAITRRRR